jgi:hypothetical protein
MEGKTHPEICDTGMITCRIECEGCVAAFALCMGQRSESDPATVRCREEMSGCVRKSAATAGNMSRPLIMFEGGDGSTIESAVVIKGAGSTREGILAENLWISKSHGDWRKDGQALVTQPGGRHYDRIEYVTPTGRQVIYFDISDFFFGKR